MTKMRRKILVPARATPIALVLFVFQALPAFACGGLVAPNGAVRLSRATTFVAWHEGIERYLTALQPFGVTIICASAPIRPRTSFNFSTIQPVERAVL